MKNYILTSAFCFLSFNLFAQQKTTKKFDHNTFQKMIAGCWRVVLYKEGKIYSLTKKELKNIKTSKICISNNGISYFEEPFANPKFTIEKVDVDSGLWDTFNETQSRMEMRSSIIYHVQVDYKIQNTKTKIWYPSRDEWMFDGKNLLIGYAGCTLKLKKCD
ncbi:hypothetical protein [Pedobacter frigoris]|uniref:hypothetical protein n=1 Tax=Pedobacter frigoris TaxID=2571272 RepID=UPI00292E3167|nr:hypothetical protein [Pedobacter frigoris]